MSYRPDNQSLAVPARKIIKGIDELNENIRERARSGEWSTEHIKKINKLHNKLVKLSLKLQILSEEQW
jgi:Rad3-related DNA helicase